MISINNDDLLYSIAHWRLGTGTSCTNGLSVRTKLSELLSLVTADTPGAPWEPDDLVQLGKFPATAILAHVAFSIRHGTLASICGHYTLPNSRARASYRALRAISRCISSSQVLRRRWLSPASIMIIQSLGRVALVRQRIILGIVGYNIRNARAIHGQYAELVDR